MTSFEHLLRLVCVPIAMCLFLLAAQGSGGLVMRAGPMAQLALK